MDILALAFVAGFVLMFIVYRALNRRAARPTALREIEAFDSLALTVGQAVETGKRLHVSLGSSALGDAHTAATLAGLSVLDQVSDSAALSDKPPVITTADGPTALLAEDALHNVYKRQNAPERFDPNAARVVGTEPLAFGAGLTSLVNDETVAGTILIGSVGPEAVLLTEAGQRAKVTALAGSDDPATQALLFTSAQYPLVGEELFAGGAYIAGGRPAHRASLQTQDTVRLLIGLVILAGVLAKTLGLF